MSKPHPDNPTPYRLRHGYLVGANGYDVADLRDTPDDTKAFVVAACNAHADLLAACEAALPYVEECRPRPTHYGPCTPESGCDAGCMDMATWSDNLTRCLNAVANAKGGE